MRHHHLDRRGGRVLVRRAPILAVALVGLVTSCASTPDGSSGTASGSSLQQVAPEQQMAPQQPAPSDDVGSTGVGTAAPAPDSDSSIADIAPEPATAPASVGSTPPLGPMVDVRPDAQQCELGASDDSAGATVVVWTVFGGAPAREVFDELVEEFNAEHDAIELVSVAKGGFEEMMNGLSTTPFEQWPDILVAPPAELRRLVDTGKIVPPGSCPGGEHLADELLNGVAVTYEVDGVLQAVPFGVSTPVLMFDIAEYAAAGLDPNSPPRDMEGLLAASRRIVDSGVSPYGLVVAEQDGALLIQQWTARRNVSLAVPSNGRSRESIRVDLVTQENTEALAALRRAVVDSGAVWIGTNTSSYDDLIRVASERDGATMTIHTSAAIGDILGYIEGGSFPDVVLGVAALPGPNAGSLVGGNAMFLIDHGDPGRVGAAWTVEQWLSAPPQLGRFDAATGYVPPGPAVAADPSVVAAWARIPQMKVGWEQLRVMPATDEAAGALFGPSSYIAVTLAEATAEVVDGGRDPGEVLAEVTDTINRLLADYEDVIGAVE